MGGDHGEAPCKLRDGKAQTPTTCTPTASAEPSTATEKVGQQPDLPTRNTPTEAQRKWLASDPLVARLRADHSLSSIVINSSGLERLEDAAMYES